MAGSELEDDVKATAEDLIEDAERLKQIEQTKLSLDPSDSRLSQLTDEAEQVVARMFPKAEAQSQLASEADSG